MDGLHRRYGGSGTIQLYMTGMPLRGSGTIQLHMTGMPLRGEWDYSVVHDRNAATGGVGLFSCT